MLLSQKLNELRSDINDRMEFTLELSKCFDEAISNAEFLQDREKKLQEIEKIINK